MSLNVFNDESSEGEDCIWTFQITTPTGAARDITGATIRVRLAMTEDPDSEVLLEQSADITDGPSGAALWTMTAAQARTLRAKGDASGAFCRQIHCTYANGTEEMWLRGRHKLTVEL